jgi:hypothetical protein
MIRAISTSSPSGMTGSLGTDLTRGGLVAAWLEANVSGAVVKVPCHFNPSELALSKTVDWTENEVIGMNIPKVEFKQGKPMGITLNLFFDSTINNSNVRKTTDKLWKFAMIDPATIDAASKKGRPAEVTFTWDQFTFKGAVTSMTHTYILFSEMGVPLRAKVAITLKQIEHTEITEVQASTAVSTRIGTGVLAGMLGAVIALTAAAISAAASSTNSSTSASTKKKNSGSGAGVMAQEGTRIDHVAAATTGDTSNQRQVAENNNIDNPMKLPKGQVIR